MKNMSEAWWLTNLEGGGGIDLNKSTDTTTWTFLVPLWNCLYKNGWDGKFYVYFTTMKKIVGEIIEEEEHSSTLF